MAKKKTENIKAAPVLRAESGGGGDQPTPTPEQTGTRTYQIMDPWKDRDVVNLVDVKAVDGEITEVKVNGVPAGGGGGGDFSMAQVVISNNTENEIDIGGVPVIDIETDALYTKEYISTGTMSLSIVLYKGGPTSFSFATTADVTVTGSIQKSQIGLQMKEIYITGDGTITIS